MAVVLSICRTNWSGTTGGPGLTQLAFEAPTDPHSWDAAAAQRVVNAVRAAWVSIGAYLPDNIKLDVNPVVDTYDIVSGDLVGSSTAAAVPAQVAGTATANFSMAAGCKVNLNTGQIRNGRRVRGSVFIVPAASNAFTTDGLVLGTARSAINAAFAGINTTLASSNEQMTVWSRPIPEGKQYGPRDGASTLVTGFETSEKTAILKGRRD